MEKKETSWFRLPKTATRLTTVGVFTLGIGFLPLACHPQESIRPIQALAGKTNFPNNLGAAIFSHPYDSIVIFGAGNSFDRESFQSSEHGKDRLKAGALALYQGFAPRAVLVDGKLPPNVSISSAEEFFLSQYQNFQIQKRQQPGSLDEIKERITLIEGPINTASEARELGRLFRQERWKKVLMITNGYHLKRATLLSLANGVMGDSKSAEDILKENNLPYNRKVRTYTLIKEKVELIALIWDPTGIIPTSLAYLTRT